MNIAELEELLDVGSGSHEVSAPPLRDLVEGGSRLRRRRRLLQVGATSTAVLAVIGVGVTIRVGTNSSDGGATTPPPASTGPTANVGDPIDPVEIVGTWYPRTVDGLRFVNGGRFPLESLAITFGKDGIVSASDGCNAITAHYALTSDGQLTFDYSGFGRTQVGCDPTPSDDVLQRVDRVSIMCCERGPYIAAEMSLYNARGDEIATYVQPTGFKPN